MLERSEIERDTTRDDEIGRDWTWSVAVHRGFRGSNDLAIGALSAPAR